MSKSNSNPQRTKMYVVLILCSLMLLASIGAAFFLIRGLPSGSGADADAPSVVESAPMVLESDYNKDENVIDTARYTATILEPTEDAGQQYVNETLFLGDSNTARMYRLFDFCSYDNAAGSVGMTANSLATFACVKFSGRSGYVTMPEAVALMQPRRVVLTFGTNDLNPGLSAEKFVAGYLNGILAVHNAYPAADIIINAIPPLGQYHSNSSLTQSQVDEFNKALVQMCEDQGWKFLNSAEVLKDPATGYARDGYVESDGIHLTRAALEALFGYLRTHSYLTEDTRPPLTDLPAHIDDKDVVTYTVPVVNSTPSSQAASAADSADTAEPAPTPDNTLVYEEPTPAPDPIPVETPQPDQPSEPETTPAPDPEPAPEPSEEPSPTPAPTIVSQVDPTCTEPGWYTYSDGTTASFGGPLGHVDDDQNGTCDRCGGVIQ